MKRFVIIAGVFIFFTLFSYTQDAVEVYRKGLPFMKNYTPDEIGAGEQNWAVIMDNRGVMYFGNGDNGVLEFDGVNWRSILISNKSIVRSLGIDNNGTIYVGAVGELGYLKPDDLGKLQYVSLLNKIDTTNRDFNNVWKTIFYKNHIYFCCPQKLFKYSPEKDSISVINPNDFGFKYGFMSFIIKNRFYHGDFGAGLLEFDADTFRVVKGGDYFHMNNITGMIPCEDNKIRIGTYENGIVLYNPETGDIKENIISADANSLYIVRELTLDEKVKLKNGDELDLSKGSLNNDNYLLEQVNADKMPIGISVKKFDHFSNTDLVLEPGLSLYMLSDGYVDQFGGPLGKKYMSRKFKRLILDIQDKSMEEQGKILDDTLIGWIGDLDQIDDVLVVGLKME